MKIHQFSNQLFSQLRVYKNSSYTDLFVKFSCYKFFQYPMFVKNMEKMYNFSKKTLGGKLTSVIVKSTAGRSFIGGENNYQMSLKVNQINNEDELSTIISLSIEAQEIIEILPQEMDNIRDFYVESAQILSKMQKKNMIAVKLSPLCHYNTLLKLNQNQKFLFELVQEDITVQQVIYHKLNLIKFIFSKFIFQIYILQLQFEQILQNNNIIYTQSQLQDFLRNILHTESDQILHMNWVNYMHAFFVEESKNQDFIVQQLSPLTEEESQYAFQFYQRLNTIVNEIHTHDLQGVFDAEQSIFQYQIWSVNIQLQTIYNKEKPILFQTIQNYLSDSQILVEFEIERQKKFGTILAIKMVRGAYMVFEDKLAKENNTKYPICANFEETSEMMNNNIQNIVQNLGDSGEVIIASHNEYTNYEITKLLTNDKLKQQVQFAHLLGLGDNLSYLLKNQGFQVRKYVPYGTIDQMMPYLIRRAQESCSVLSTVHIINDAIKQELRYRMRK